VECTGAGKSDDGLLAWIDELEAVVVGVRDHHGACENLLHRPGSRRNVEHAQRVLQPRGRGLAVGIAEREQVRWVQPCCSRESGQLCGGHEWVVIGGPRALTSADDGLGITPILPEVYGTHGARFGVGYEEGHVSLFTVVGNTQS